MKLIDDCIKGINNGNPAYLKLKLRLKMDKITIDKITTIVVWTCFIASGIISIIIIINM